MLIFKAATKCWEKLREPRALAILLLCGVCFGAGWVGAYRVYKYIPEQQMTRIANQEADIQERTRHGVVEQVETMEIKIKFTQAADRRQVGTDTEYRIDPLTNVQIGPDIINEPGITPDATYWFKPGDRVEVIQRKGTKDKASLIRRDLRTGEAPYITGPQL